MAQKRLSYLAIEATSQLVQGFTINKKAPQLSTERLSDESKY